MAIQWGNTSGYFRLGIDLVGTTLIVYGQSVGYGHNWSGTLSLGGSWSGSPAVSFYSGSSQTVTKEFYRKTISASGTYTASISYWNGSSSVSRSVSFGSPPGQVTGVTLNRTSDVDMIVKWNAVSGATGYKVWRSLTGTSGSWILTKQNATTNSHTMPNMPFDERHYISVSAYNSIGTGPDSAVAGPFYSKPATPTNLVGKATTSGYEFTVKNNAKYPYGLEIQVVGGETFSSGTGTSGNVGGLNIPYTSLAYAANRQFRARAFAGPTTSRSYSDWTGSVITTVDKPSVKLTAFRVTGTGTTPNPVGNKIRVRVITSAPNVASNKLKAVATLIVKNATTGAVNSNLFSNQASSPEINHTGILTGTADITKVYEVTVVVTDSWGVTTTESVDIPVGQVPLSLSKTGAGVGKVWERGTLDVLGDVYLEGALKIKNPPTPYFQRIRGTAANLSNGPATATVATHTFNIATKSAVIISCTSEVKPSGNASGTLAIALGSSTLGDQTWHSNSTTDHQWPSVVAGTTLEPGTHTINIVASTHSGSVATNYSYINLGVIAIPLMQEF